MKFILFELLFIDKKRTKYSNISEIDQKSYIMQTKIIIVNYVPKKGEKKLEIITTNTKAWKENFHRK